MPLTQTSVANDPRFPATVLSIDIDPLISAIAVGKAVVYVGAGASVPAGLPTWAEFLRQCVARAEATFTDDQRKWQNAAESLKRGDFLYVAELLQKSLGPELLRHYIFDIFSAANSPSQIHHAIARIPFSLAVTTNYDDLLENACPSGTPVWTWRQPEAVFSAIKRRIFSIIKTHGSLRDPTSLVLTKSQYRGLMYDSSMFSSCLHNLLTLRTFLFVGTSLRDVDLLKLLDEAKLVHGVDFGPHYAILFEDETDDDYIAFLRECYSLHIIRCRMNDPLRSPPEPRQMSDAMTAVLREISGLVALKASLGRPWSRFDAPMFNAADEALAVLGQAVRETGAFRGDICLINPKTEHRQAITRVAEVATDCVSAKHGFAFTPQPTLYPGAPPIYSAVISHDSVCGSLFLRRSRNPNLDCIYLSNTSLPQLVRKELDNQGFPETSYKTCHSAVRSELAIPIVSDGNRVGVLNLESNECRAFAPGHVHAAQHFADVVGQVYHQTRLRTESARGLEPYFSDPSAFSKLMAKSRLLKALDLRYILYEIDYANGQMIGHSDSQRVPGFVAFPGEFCFGFQDRSLATWVLRHKKGAFVPDAARDSAAVEPMLDQRGVEVFGIRGPVIGIPVQKNGHFCSVVVAWSELNKVPIEQLKEEGVERLQRLVQLVANSPDVETEVSAEGFIDELNTRLTPIDKAHLWAESLLENERSRVELFRKCLQALVSPSCGLRRVRLWEADRTDRMRRFVCAYSLTCSDARIPGEPTVDAHKGVCGTADDEYVSYTLARFRESPNARWQHRSMFGQVDANSVKLGKDPDGSWIVGPIVQKGKLLGYLSADNQRYIGAKRRTATAEKTHCTDVAVHPAIGAFQLAAVDLVTHMLVHAVVHDRKAMPARSRK